jgi:hypothetical protein
VHSFTAFHAVPRYPESCSWFSLRRKTTKFIALCRGHCLTCKEAPPIAEDPLTCFILTVRPPCFMNPKLRKRSVSLNCDLFKWLSSKLTALLVVLLWPGPGLPHLIVMLKIYSFLVFGYGPDMPGVLCIRGSSASVEMHNQLFWFGLS